MISLAYSVLCKKKSSFFPLYFFHLDFVVYLSGMLFNLISNLMSWISDNLHLFVCAAVFKPFAAGVLLLLMLRLHTL